MKQEAKDSTDMTVREEKSLISTSQTEKTLIIEVDDNGSVDIPVRTPISCADDSCNQIVKRIVPESVAENVVRSLDPARKRYSVFQCILFAIFLAGALFLVVAGFPRPEPPENTLQEPVLLIHDVSTPLSSKYYSDVKKAKKLNAEGEYQKTINILIRGFEEAVREKSFNTDNRELCFVFAEAFIKSNLPEENEIVEKGKKLLYELCNKDRDEVGWEMYKVIVDTKSFHDYEQLYDRFNLMRKWTEKDILDNEESIRILGKYIDDLHRVEKDINSHLLKDEKKQKLLDRYRDLRLGLLTAKHVLEAFTPFEPQSKSLRPSDNNRKASDARKEAFYILYKDAHPLNTTRAEKIMAFYEKNLPEYKGCIVDMGARSLGKGYVKTTLKKMRKQREQKLSKEQ